MAFKHEGVEDTKERCVDADAQRQRDDRNEVKPGFFRSVRTP